MDVSDIERWLKIKFEADVDVDSDAYDDGGYGIIYYEECYANPLFYARKLYLNGKPVKNLRIPNGIKSISDIAFINCASLESVYIPKTVKKIGYHAFSGCRNLKNVYYAGTKAEWKSVKINEEDSSKNVLFEKSNQELLKAKMHFGCGNHSFKKTVTKATPAADGKVFKKCTKCDWSEEKVIGRVSKISLSDASLVYNGKAERPKVVVKDSKGRAIDSKYYTVTFSNAKSKSIGTYKVTVKLKGSLYSGEKVLKYKIVPAQVRNLKKLKVTSSAVDLSWSGVPGAKYYALQYSKDGKNWSFATKRTTATSFSVKKLKSGTNYSFRVKALDSTRKYSGKYSVIFRVKTKS